MPLIGFIVGYSLTSIPYFKLNHRVRRTVATEVALQNATVCSAVINGSFPIALIGKMVVFPLLYYIFQLAYSIFLIIFYRVMKFKVSSQIYSYFLKNAYFIFRDILMRKVKKLKMKPTLKWIKMEIEKLVLA